VASVPSVLLIFGTSHVGKSTLAAKIGAANGSPILSTDKMGRHPGRPWPNAKPQVAEFYSKLTDDTIYWFLRRHHENMWPLIRQTLQDGLQSEMGLVIEGSALRPEFLAELPQTGIQSVGLYAENGFLRQRIETESNYLQRDKAARTLIDAFVRRSLTDNDHLVDAARRLGLPLVDVSNEKHLEDWIAELSKHPIEKDR